MLVHFHRADSVGIHMQRTSPTEVLGLRVKGLAIRVNRKPIDIEVQEPKLREYCHDVSYFSKGLWEGKLRV